jgi:hypothetical protein
MYACLCVCICVIKPNHLNVWVIWALEKFLYTSYITDKMEVQYSCSRKKIVYINYVPNVSLFTLHADEISAS